MTAALNRKFDLLQKSGTCPSYLLDVLTLLVAHANETELFKQELRSAPFENAAPPLCADRGVVAAVAPQAEVGAQTEAKPAALSVEQGVFLAAEKTLCSYASDLKKINDIAMATSSKRLREMKASNLTEVAALRDRAVREAVERAREELDSLRVDWLVLMNKEVERAKMEVHQVGLSSQKALHKMVEGYCGYVSDGFQLLKTEPLEVTHRAMAECAFCVERVKILGKQMVPRIEVDALRERLKSVERVITQTVHNSSPPGILRDDTFAASMVKSSKNEASAAAAEDVRPLGLRLRDGGGEVEGLIVMEVAPNSPASKARIGPGQIISHVGGTPVTRRDDFIAAIQKTGSVAKLTVYDPETAGRSDETNLQMALAKCEKWRSPGSRDADTYPWDVSRLDWVLAQATAPKATIEKKLWCVQVIMRCVETAAPGEQIELRRNRQLLPTLRYFFSHPISTPLGTRLRQHTLSVYLHLLGKDLAFDEVLVMDVDTVNILAAALGDDKHAELNHVAILLARRISELPHVSSILVFEDALFDVLQDLLETRHTLPRVTKHILHLFVNLSGHPKLHFKLARSRRLVFFSTETLLRVLSTEVVDKASRKMHRVMKSVPSSFDEPHENSSKRQPLAFGPALSRDVGCALRHMSTAVPCAMIIANLLSFPENRASMLSLYPDLVPALELCDSQKVSVRLWEVARCAIDYLHEDEAMMERQLLMHFESPTVDDGNGNAGDSA